MLSNTIVVKASPAIIIGMQEHAVPLFSLRYRTSISPEYKQTRIVTLIIWILKDQKSFKVPKNPRSHVLSIDF